MNFPRFMMLATFLTWMSGSYAQDSDRFGRAKSGEAALMGVLYDFKQTQDKRLTDVDTQRYAEIVDDFLVRNWDEAVLNGFYRVSKPLFTTQVFIPFMDADNAPRAFGVEGTVKPSRWLIHYKGQVSPPAPGTYRFLGTADDVMAVAINGRTNLVAHLRDTYLPRCPWRPQEMGAAACWRQMTYGDWFTVEKNEIVDLDIINGERPGLAFNAFLLIQRKGESYLTESGGNPILPIFQVAAYDTPEANGTAKQPRFSKNSPIWICHQ